MQEMREAHRWGCGRWKRKAELRVSPSGNCGPSLSPGRKACRTAPSELGEAKHICREARQCHPRVPQNKVGRGFPAQG